MTACFLHKSPMSKLMFVVLDKESNITTLWRREEFLKLEIIICSREDLAEKAQDEEVIIPVKRSRKTQYRPQSRVF